MSKPTSTSSTSTSSLNVASAASFTKKRAQSERETIEIDEDEEEEIVPQHTKMKKQKQPLLTTKQPQHATAKATATASSSTTETTNALLAYRDEDEDDEDNMTAAGAAASSSRGGDSTIARAVDNYLRNGSRSVLDSYSSLLLPYHRDIIRQMTREDGLVILGRGLGAEHVWAGFLSQYLHVLPTAVVQQTIAVDAALTASSASAAAASSSATPSSASPHLVFLLNFDDEMIQWLNEVYQTHHRSDPSLAQNDTTQYRSRGIRQINNEYNVNERQQLYLQGGLLAITARILTVDLLNSIIATDLISGFCIHNAHHVSDISPEAFILRIYRKKNKTGWIKAMSDEPMSFQRGTSSGGANGKSGAFSGLDVVMKALFLRKVWLYPRFTISVNETLNPPPKEEEEDEEAETRLIAPHPILLVEEVHQPFSELMNSVQMSLIELIDTLITQLKSENRHLSAYDGLPQHGGGSKSDASVIRTVSSLNLSIEAGLMKNFETILRNELDPLQHKLSSKTRTILADMKELRLCLTYLISHDSVSFWRHLYRLRAAAAQNSGGHGSTWLLSESAEKLFRDAKKRVYQLQPGMSLQEAERAKALWIKQQTLKLKADKKAKVEKKSKTKGGASGGGGSRNDAMELSDDEDAASTAAAAAAAASITSLPPTFATEDSIQLVLEENTKWQQLIDLLEEIEQDVMKRTAEHESQMRENELGEIMRGGGGGSSKSKKSKDTKSAVKSESTTDSSSSASAPPLHLPASFGRTLIIVRESRTAAFLTRFLTMGGRTLLKDQFRRYLSDLKLWKRVFTPTTTNNATTSNAAASSKQAPPLSSMSSAYQQVMRENAALKREWERLAQIEHYERYSRQKQFAEVQRKERMEQEAARQKAQRAEEESGFDLDDEKQPTLTQLAREEKEKLAEEAKKRKDAKEKKKPTAAASSTPSTSPTKSTFNPYKRSSQPEYSIENLDADDVDAHDAEMAAAAAIVQPHETPQLVFEPSTKPSLATKGKRGSSDVTDETSTARKKAKVGGGGGSEAKEDSEQQEGSEAQKMDDDEPHAASGIDGDDGDAEMIDRKGAAEEEAAIAEAASAFDPSKGANVASMQGMTPTVNPYLYDRSDFSIIDANFKMNAVPPTVPTNVPSPFFPGSNASASSSSHQAAIESLSHLTSSTTVSVLPSFQLLIHPLQNLHSILHHYAPEYVIIFDPEVVCIRELEVFQALPSTTWQIRVYFMLYSNSIEEQRYLTSIEQENRAFEHLIQTKKTMVIPVEQDGKVPEAAARVLTAEEKKNSHLYDDGVRNSTYEAYAATLPKTNDTRRGGAAVEGPGTILVDVREFRSSLPSLLHAANLTIQPLTLEIADYILTPTLAIERKSVPDLIGSLASGRLYKQMEQAIRYYKTPVLLIEFDRGRPFLLQARSEISSEISAKSVQSKLTLLILHFPQMRILWSRDSHATANLFLALKQNQAQPTIEQAVTANTNTLKNQQAGYEFADLSASVGLTEDEKDAQNLSLTPHDILRKLPGVTVNNIRTILQNVNNLRELCDVSQEDLIKWCGGTMLGKKLFSFLHDEP